jgi:hypothetical protein
LKIQNIATLPPARYIEYGGSGDFANKRRLTVLLKAVVAKGCDPFELLL